MPRAKTVFLSSLSLALLAGLCWTGREAGKRMARAGWFQKEAAVRKTIIAPPEQASRKSNDPQAAAKALRRLKFLSEGSANLDADWEARAEILAILESLSATELAEIYAAMEEGLLFQSASIQYPLSFEVLAAWMRLDPAAALTAGARDPRLIAHNAFVSWSMEDPAGAFDWLDSGDFPAGLADEMNALKKDELRAGALHAMLGRDFDRATAEFLKLEPGGDDWNGRDGVIRRWATRSLFDPAQRERLVAFAKSTGRPEDHAAMNDALFRHWPQEDALGLLTYLQDLREYQESADIPAEKRPEMDATAVGAAIYREYDRPALEWWMERYADSPDVPGPLQDSLAAWQQKYPDKVAQWFAEQPPSLQRDALQASLVPSFIATGKWEDAARVIGDIADPMIRQSAIERLDYVWSRKAPDAAAAWREGR
ncbi:hypothetical protein [Luteolibacter marinus]|uniref:hypothetical protein n=1 Tax=Luteolibacter marinus TaxID=2776705 RepID=UPI001866D304|nr:hypothetical protein [Luteolibacter marinus]